MRKSWNFHIMWKSTLFLIFQFDVILDTPCGGLPVLCINGTEIAQSIAVARFCARECQIDGKTNLEKAQADMIVDCVTDCFLAFIPELFGKENTFKTEALPNFFKLMNKFLKANGGKYFVGKEVSWIFD